MKSSDFSFIRFPSHLTKRFRHFTPSARGGHIQTAECNTDGRGVVHKKRGKREKRNFPPHPPYREKLERRKCPASSTRAREGNLTCEGVPILSLDEVKSAAPGLGVDLETAETFWNFFYALGWKYKGDTIRKWQPMLKAWKNTRSRLERRDEKLIAHFDERAEKRQAHIDAKMDERERKRERRMNGRKKADNNVEMTDEVREAVRRDFDF